MMARACSSLLYKWQRRFVLPVGEQVGQGEHEREEVEVTMMRKRTKAKAYPQQSDSMVKLAVGVGEGGWHSLSSPPAEAERRGKVRGNA